MLHVITKFFGMLRLTNFFSFDFTTFYMYFHIPKLLVDWEQVYKMKTNEMKIWKYNTTVI